MKVLKYQIFAGGPHQSLTSVFVCNKSHLKSWLSFALTAVSFCRSAERKEIPDHQWDSREAETGQEPAQKSQRNQRHSSSKTQQF